MRFNTTKPLPSYHHGNESGGYHAGSREFPPGDTQWRCTVLHPACTYQFSLEVDNGAHIVTSPKVNADTDDGGYYFLIFLLNRN